MNPLVKEIRHNPLGGTVISNEGTFDPYDQTPAGQTFHGDHAYVFFQIPVNARKLPLVLWHGAGQFSKTWGTTPGGREGYQNIFLRRGFGVYVIDQPRRGDAGRSTLPMTITPTPDEQGWFGSFRLGIWPDFFPGVRFSRDPKRSGSVSCRGARWAKDSSPERSIPRWPSTPYPTFVPPSRASRGRRG